LKLLISGSKISPINHFNNIAKSSNLNLEIEAMNDNNIYNIWIDSKPPVSKCDCWWYTAITNDLRSEIDKANGYREEYNLEYVVVDNIITNDKLPPLNILIDSSDAVKTFNNEREIQMYIANKISGRI
jgi:hypothetical protein